MADAEAKAKAEKLAAAKKRVEQLKKQKAKKAGGEGEKASPALETAKDEEPVTATEDTPSTADTTAADAPSSPSSDAQPPSISVQSKLRSSSFRQGGGGPLSPSAEGETAPEIHKKQAARIEELEKENKRLSREALEAEQRWKKSEEELEELRDAEVSKPAHSSNASDEDVERLHSEITALQRQNAQLQAQSSRTVRHGSISAISTKSSAGDMAAQLASKAATIENMEIEMSNLRAQLARTASGSSAEKEQIAALEDKLSRTERLLDTSQQELKDLKKNLERTTEKAVKEGSERTSAETKSRTLAREAEEAKSMADELQKKADGLEKKITALTTLHKEHDARFQTLRKEREKADKDASDLRNRLATIENENLRLREERERAKKRDAQGADDDGVDELEDEERRRLEGKVRDLEGEISELRRGIWKERRREIEGEASSGLTSPGAKFTDVDLGAASPTRQRTLAPGNNKGLGDLFANSFSAFAGVIAPPPTSTSNGVADALLEDEEMDFDEEAFRTAQADEARRRIERVKEIKRGLSEWKGYRLDLVDSRRSGGEGLGEVFEI